MPHLLRQRTLWWPRGAPYARGPFHGWHHVDHIDARAIGEITAAAVRQYVVEHGDFPDRGKMTIEVNGSVAGVQATVYVMKLADDDLTTVMPVLPGPPGRLATNVRWPASPVTWPAPPARRLGIAALVGFVLRRKGVAAS